MFSWRNKKNSNTTYYCLLTHQNPPYQKSSLPKIFFDHLEQHFFFFFLNGKFTMITLNSRTNRPEQTVQAQFRLLKEQSDLGLHCLPFHLHILGTPFMGIIDLLILYDVIAISVVWVYTVTVCKILSRIL